ncbi:MAG TPA: transcriptional activator domain-containing protein, partial [Microlunatus sp.]|nr:transcriptional activator domain-containing protein [Microlunatus sp.]
GRPVLAVSTAASSLATYRPRGLRWCTAASLLLGAYGSLMLGDTGSATRDATEAAGILTPLGDAWGLVHAEAMLGGIAEAEHRFDDAAPALRRAAEESARLGFLGQAALHRATLARVQHRMRDPQAAGSYLQAIGEAVASGDGRLAATARLNLARLRRDVDDSEARALLEENERWYASAGGGEFAQLTHCLLAAVHDDASELETVLEEARVSNNVEVQVCALDALARLAAQAGDSGSARTLLSEADSLALQVAHVLDEDDRLDGSRARQLLS